jgi:hypothetical protein
MSDENQSQNPTPEENSIPSSPQEPTELASENTAHSEPSTMPPDALESPRDSADAVPVNNDNQVQNEPEAVRPESGEAQKVPENQDYTSAESESIEADKPTAQKPVFEPLVETIPKEVSLVSSKPKLSQKDLWRRFLDKVSIGKRKKLDKIMALFLQQSKITNDEVEKFLHVSDATATRYLSILEKEGKIKQNGKTGHMVSYSRI